MPGQGEPLASAFDSDEFSSYGSLAGADGQWCAEAKRIRPGGGNRAVRRELDPGDNRRVVGPRREFHPHWDTPSQALDDAHQTRRACSSPGHKINHADGSLLRLEIGLEH